MLTAAQRFGVIAVFGVIGLTTLGRYGPYGYWGTALAMVVATGVLVPANTGARWWRRPWIVMAAVIVVAHVVIVAAAIAIFDPFDGPP